jgi:hypothetical protein
MNTFIVHADSKVSKALIAIFKALNVTFEVEKTAKKTKESPYDPEFVKMILESSKESGGKLLTENYKKELFKSI